MVNAMRRLTATALMFLAATALLTGCGSSRKGPPVTGVVTVDTRPVRSGQVTFVGGPKGEKSIAAIGFDGRYTIDLPPGDYKVGVEGGNLQSAAGQMAHVPTPKAPKEAASMKDHAEPGAAPVDLSAEAKNPVIVPMKYRAPDSSTLSVTVPAAGTTFDIPLKSK